MPTLTEDLIAHGPWLVSSWGENLALGFKGPTSYIERSFNWATNTGVIGRGARLCWYHEAVTGKLAYVCPKSRRAIKRGVLLQIAAEIRLSREVPLLADHSKDDDWDGPPEDMIVWDDYRIYKAASKRANAFMDEHVIRDSFILDRDGGVGSEYSVGSMGWRGSED